MRKYVKVIYEDVQEEGGIFVTELQSALAPFSERNTVFSDSVSYRENFEQFMQDAFECGYIYLTPDHAISILQIKSYLAHDPVAAPEQKAKPNQQKKQNQQKKAKKVNRRRVTPKPNPTNQKLPKLLIREPSDADLVADKV